MKGCSSCGVFVCILCALVILAGFYFVVAERFAKIELSIGQYRLASNSIGFSMVFLGLVAILIFAGIKSKRSPGGAGGTAEVIGGGEARGGKGGHAGSFGPGGKGGDARVDGKGKAIGGEGGDG